MSENNDAFNNDVNKNYNYDPAAFGWQVPPELSPPEENQAPAQSQESRPADINGGYTAAPVYDSAGTAQQYNYGAGQPTPPAPQEPTYYGEPSYNSNPYYYNSSQYDSAQYAPPHTEPSKSNKNPPVYGWSFSESAAPPAGPSKAEPMLPKKKKGGAGKFVALAVVLSLISGIIGGGVSYTLLKDSLANQQIQAPAVSSSEALSASPGIIAPGSAKSSVENVVAVAAPSVVEVSTEENTNNPFFGEYIQEGAGSGVILTEDGYIVTNNHVVRSATTVKVRTFEGKEYNAKLIGVDEQTDLAVIKIETTGLKPVSLADSSKIQVGQLAVAIGNPLGTLGGTVTEGIISAKDREILVENETMTLLQTSAAVNPGNSGGGLFDENGQLVGIVNAKSGETNVEGLGFAIPSNTVKTITDELMTNGYVSGRPKLGITVVTIEDMQTAIMYRLDTPGLYIASPGENKGLETGDRIISIDGQKVMSMADIRAILEKHTVGDTLTIRVERGDKTYDVPIVLKENVPQNASDFETQSKAGA
ncbi:MAG: trypsin-like peptidase domain-containing protein [Oscillospiraceae bacterium]|jgi:serine protease Do|nr:trypsin-like peptidase domain-containing protein [Oscillospiraceae bacterium]